MQHHIIYKKSAFLQVINLLMIIPVTALADGDFSDSSWQQVAGGGNPWAIPGSPESHPGFIQPPEFQNQDEQEQADKRRLYKSNRFVTPEFLESLRQQQSQYQVMPENQQYLPPSPRSGSVLPTIDPYAYPGYGLDYVDPLYEAPVLNPWGVDDK